MNQKVSSNRRYMVGFSIAGSLLIILMSVFINYNNWYGFPWFIYPTFAVLWWPLCVVSYKRHSPKMLASAGSFLIIILLFLTNMFTSHIYLWFVFPSFAVLWWPLSLFFCAKNPRLFSLIGCFAIIIFAVLSNYLTSPSYIWFYYPVFTVLWWPLSVYLAQTKTIKIYSIIGAILLLALFATDNIINVSDYPWALLTVYPILMWPICMFLSNNRIKLVSALIFSLIGIIYYSAMNILVFTGFPWAIFPAYALLWWPLSMAFHGRGRSMLLAVCGAVLSAALFIATNLVASPHTVWAVYPIFALVWWPLSVYYFVYKPRRIK